MPKLDRGSNGNASVGNFATRVIRQVKRIPVGRVSTYGTIAALADSPRAALMVGRILRSSSEAEALPWQRVINSQGEISIVNIHCPPELQAELLRQEGVAVSQRGGRYWVDLKKFGWFG